MVTADNARLLLTGAAAAALVTAVATATGRRRVGPFLAAAATVGAVLAVPRREGAVAWAAVDLVGLAAGVWAAAGAGLLHRAGRRRGVLVPLLLLATLLGIWAGVPENRHVLVITGAVAGFTAAGALPVPPLSRLGAAALALAVPWSVAVGVARTDLRYLGAVACLGVLLWWPVVVRRRRWAPRPAAILLAGHAVFALVAARWIAVAPDATVWRLVVVVAAAGAWAAATAVRAPSS